MNDRARLEAIRTSIGEIKATGPLLKRLEWILRTLDEVLEDRPYTSSLPIIDVEHYQVH